VEGGINPIAATIPAATLTCWGHVTSSVRWPFHSQYAVSYRWSPITVPASCTATRYGASNILGLRPWSFGG